jgi:hypothetical protein
MNRTPPDNTEEQQAPRWQPGQSGNPAGRPKGSRNKLSEAFLQALADDFDANGAEVIERVRQERPHDYLKVCASVMPRRLESARALAPQGQGPEGRRASAGALFGSPHHSDGVHPQRRYATSG